MGGRLASFALSFSLLACSAQNAEPPADAAGEAAIEQPRKPEVKTALASAGSRAQDGHSHDDSCIHGHGPSCGVAVLPAAAVAGHFGASFALPKPRPLAELVGTEESVADTVQVSGTVDSVCQKKGCWMVLRDGDKTARILMKDHAFVVPMDSKGKHAVVEGLLESRRFSEAQVKHLEQDRGGDPATVSGERTEYVLTATGVQITES